MLNRQKIAVKVLQACGGTASRLQLMKLLFLLEQEFPSAGGNAFYRFMPYQYGPYSFSLQHEVSQLARDGMIREGETTWNLTDVGYAFQPSLSAKIEHDIESLVKKYGSFSMQRLRNDVYERYPWFTLLTVLEGRRAVPRPIAELAIYTMGYEGMVVEGFVDHLLRKGIARVIDVRSNPVSRRYGFHLGTLSRICRSIELDYQHFPELGIPSAQRIGVRKPEDTATLLATYEAAILPQQKDAVIRLAGMLKEGPGVLVCMEAEPNLCHRSRLADALKPLTGYPVIHLGGQR
jgi:uncharacterized protein (DUF488 family)